MTEKLQNIQIYQKLLLYNVFIERVIYKLKISLTYS